MFAGRSEEPFVGEGQVQGMPSVIHEDLLAGAVLLAKDRVQPGPRHSTHRVSDNPATVQRADSITVAVAVRARVVRLWEGADQAGHKIG